MNGVGESKKWDTERFAWWETDRHVSGSKHCCIVLIGKTELIKEICCLVKMNKPTVEPQACSETTKTTGKKDARMQSLLKLEAKGSALTVKPARGPAEKLPTYQG